MAGRAPPTPRAPAPRRWRIGIAVAQFHPALTRAMRDHARRRAHAMGAEVVVEAEAAGSYDLPLLVRDLLRRPEVDAAAALGAIVTGETCHDEAIAHALFQALLQVALEADKPVGLGVTGPGQTYAQARARIDRAGAAVEAIVKQLETRAALLRPRDGERGAQVDRPRQLERRA